MTSPGRRAEAAAAAAMDADDIHLEEEEDEVNPMLPEDVPLTQTERLRRSLSGSPAVRPSQDRGDNHCVLARTMSSQGRNLVLQNRKGRASERDLRVSDSERVDSELLKIHVASWNVGNAAPPVDLKQWIPKGGGGADIVAVCVQEATYSESDAAEDAIGSLRMTIKQITGVKGAVGPQVLTCEAKVQSDVAGYTRQSFATTAARGKESPASPARTSAPLEWAPELPANATGSHTTFNVYDSTARLKLHLSDEATLIKTIFGGTVVEVRHVGDALEVRPSVPGDGVAKDGLLHVESGEGWLPCDGGEFETTLTAGGKAVGSMVLQLQWQPEAMAVASPADDLSKTETPRTQAKRHGGAGTLHVTLHGAKDLRSCDANGLSDPYASMTIHTPAGPQQKQKTEVCKRTLSPVWENDTFKFELPSDATALRIVLKDYDDISVAGLTLGKGMSDILGEVCLQAPHLRTFMRERTEDLPVNYGGKRKGWLRVTLKFRVGAVDGVYEPEGAEPEPEPEPEPELESFGDAAIGEALREAGLAATGLAAVGAAGKKGLAEALNTTALTAGLAGDGDHHFFERVAEQLGPNYMPVGPQGNHGFAIHEEKRQVMQFTLMQMRILIMARQEIVPYTSNWQLNCQATGIGGVVANKGGIVAKFDYRGDSLAFVCTHLAAHQGEKHRLQRNEMARTVQETARVGNTRIDVGTQCEHVFWAGDLNYRIDIPDAVAALRAEIEESAPENLAALEAGLAALRGMRGGSEEAGMTHEQQLERVSDLIADLQNSLLPLRLGDELQREIALGKAFSGFTDALTHCFERGYNDSTRAADGTLVHDTWTFAPTFKTKRAVSFGYNPQRVPSFTDRVLWRSAPGREQCMELVKFSSEFELCTSDHKPVYAIFRLAVPRPLMDRIAEYKQSQMGSPLARTNQRPRQQQRVAMRLVELSATGLVDPLGGAVPNPRCQVYAGHSSQLPFAHESRSDHLMQTPPQMGTTDPSWSAADLTPMVFDCPDVSLLGGTIESPKADDAVVQGQQQLRVGYAESLILRFVSVPLGYDTATSTEKALANTKQRLTAGGMKGVTAAHVHPELGFARLVLREYEPMEETRSAAIQDEVAAALQVLHETSGEVVIKEAGFISRSFELELDMNGEGGKGRVTGKMELYHVAIAGGEGGKAAKKVKEGEKSESAGCCGSGEGGSCAVM